MWYAAFKVYPLYCCTFGFEKYSSLLTYARSLLSKLAFSFEEGLRKLAQLVIRGECLTGDDSIAYDRSFA